MKFYYATDLLDNVGAELLDRKRANIPSKLANDSIAEAIIVQVKNVLNNLCKIINFHLN